MKKLIFILAFLSFCYTVAQTTNHVVLEKETLYGISKKYNIGVDEIQSSNKDILIDGLKVGQSLKITSKNYKTYYEIAISDNGIGIEQEYFDKIFVLFQRLHRKDEYQGNGMGLAITKKIMDKLNGKIWVTSEMGVGSTFYITIPKKNKK